MAVITVSRQVGSLGTEIARESARCLNYEYVDKEKLEQLLKGSGFPEPEMEKFDEKKPPFWDSLFLERRKFLHSTQAVLYDLASKDRVVLVGRGGQVLLKDVPGTLHLRIIAPFEKRVKAEHVGWSVAERAATHAGLAGLGRCTHQTCRRTCRTHSLLQCPSPSMD